MKYIGHIITVIGLIGTMLYLGTIISNNNANVKAQEVPAQIKVVSNEQLLDQLISGSITQDEFSSQLIPLDHKHEVFMFDVWGLTITAYTPPGVESCTLQDDASNFECEWSEDIRVKCMVKVVVATGPVAGTYIFAKECDGENIVQSTWDGVKINYDTSTSQ